MQEHALRYLFNNILTLNHISFIFTDIKIILTNVGTIICFPSPGFFSCFYLSVIARTLSEISSWQEHCHIA